MRPPASEAAVGMGAYLTKTPGIGGRLRVEPEDFGVVELGAGPPRHADGRLTAARIRLRNWETNRFVSAAADRLRVPAGKVAFHGMKDKRAVTEQWFTFPCGRDRLERLAGLDDVHVLSSHRTHERAYAGGHAGNRFTIRIREHEGGADAVAATAAAVRAEGGVPRYFGPQRFGGRVRPITHLVGRAIVAGDLQEAVRLFVGHPVTAEPPAAQDARRAYERGGAAAALDALPPHLDLERRVLERLARRPDDWRHALFGLPRNLLQLFVHAWQSRLYNDILTTRLAAGLGLRTAHVGDLVQAEGEDAVYAVTAANRARVQKEVDAARASPTAPLLGTATPRATGAPGDVEDAVLAGHDPAAFRCRELPEVASAGTRRAVLQRVEDLRVAWVDGDPVLSFALGRGAYATVVLREFMKVELD